MDVCKSFYEKYEDDLIYSLCNSLLTLANKYKDLFLEVIKLLDKLLLLDEL